MKNRRNISFCLYLASFIVYLSSLYSCGYTIQGSSSLPFDAIKIVKIVNFTSEPKLQDKLYVMLTEEFLKHGIQVNDSSENILNGEITYFNLRTLSEKKEFAAEYEAIIRGNFQFTDKDGNTRKLDNISSPFIESFAGSDAISNIIASKEIAAEQALKGLSMIIVSELIY